MKIILKGTLEINHKNENERIPLRIISSNESDDITNSIQFFKPQTQDMIPNKHKLKFKGIAKDISSKLEEYANKF